jgi:hypothetical protein
MTDGDRISIIAYVRERFDKQDSDLTEIKGLVTDLAERVETLETQRDQRAGRDSFISKSAKAFAATVVTVGAAVGGYFSIKPH